MPEVIKEPHLHISPWEVMWEIVQDLEALNPTELSLQELCEQSLLYTYLWRATNASKWRERSAMYINLASEHLSKHLPSSLGLFSGLAGVGWLIQHASSIISGHSSPAAKEDDDLLDELDEYLLSTEDRGRVSSNYDLISGYVGKGIYWLERLPKAPAVEGIRRILQSLNDSAREFDSGTAWFTPSDQIPVSQRHLAPQGYYNLGVAHGIPGIIAFLALVCNRYADSQVKNDAQTLLDKSIRWLLAQKQVATADSVFAAWLVPGRLSADTGLSWCYGDLGIAAVLAHVGKITPDDRATEAATDLFDRCAKRDSIVRDSAFCHGAIGIAHLYMRAYKYLGKDLYRDAGYAWLQRALLIRKPGFGIAGYYAWRTTATPPEQQNASILEGVTGICLVLVSCLTGIEPSWDRMMLLS